MPIPAFELFDLPRYFYEVLGGELPPYGGDARVPVPVHVLRQGDVRQDVSAEKTPEQVRAEIDYALTRTPVKTVYFMDLEFTVARDLAVAICEHLIELGAPLRWCCQTRADNVDARATRAHAARGVPPHTPRRRKRLGAHPRGERQGDVEGSDILRGTRMIANAGIETLAFFMFGLPGETREDREATIAFRERARPHVRELSLRHAIPGLAVVREVGHGGRRGPVVSGCPAVGEPRRTAVVGEPRRCGHFTCGRHTCWATSSRAAHRAGGGRCGCSVVSAVRCRRPSC